MNVALQNEWISRNPVCLLNAKKTKVERGFLSEKELKSIEEVPLPVNLSIVRDVFVFAVYTGLSFVDISNLTNENIKCRYRQKLVAELLSSENGHTRHAAFIATCCLYIKEV